MRTHARIRLSRPDMSSSPSATARPARIPTGLEPVIAGIDPGLATGAAVLIPMKPAEERILAAARMSTRPPKAPDLEAPCDPQFTAAAARARDWADQALKFVCEHRPAVIAVESFVDFRSKGRGSRREQLRWTTPLVIGFLLAGLQDRIPEAAVRLQNPSVLAQFAVEISQLEAARAAGRPSEELPGSELLTSDHLVKAWCHASWCRDRVPAGDPKELS